MADATDGSGADGGGDDRADDGARREGPKRGPIQRPGSGSPAGMYGPHVGSLEIMDLMSELAQTYPDARIHLDVMGADGVKRAARTYSVTSFDFDQVTATYGAGEYRVRVQQLGQPRPVKMFRFIAATPPNPTPPPAPPQQYAPPPPPLPPPYPYPPQHYAPVENQGNAIMAAMMTMMVESAKSNATMVNTLLAKLIEQKTSPQEPAKITELESLIRLADKLSSRRSARDDDAGGNDELLGSLAAMVSKAINATPAAPAVQPAARPARPKARPITTEHAGSAALSGVAPPMASLPAGEPAPTTTPPPTPAAETTPPADPVTAAVVAHIRTNPDAKRLAKLILVDDGDDAAALAAMALSLMDDDQVDAFKASEVGSWSKMFVSAFPALAQKSALVGQVESAIRDELSDEVQPEEDTDATDDERTDRV